MEWGTPEALIALYNENAPDEWPSVEVVSDARRKKARQHLKQFPEREWWEQLFKEARLSPLLRGRVKSREHPNFQPDFDWLLSKGKNDGVENCVKVYEGKYRPR